MLIEERITISFQEQIIYFPQQIYKLPTPSAF